MSVCRILDNTNPEFKVPKRHLNLAWLLTIVIVLAYSHNVGAAAIDAGCRQRWTYATDTWRLVPDSVTINNDAVVSRLHVEDVYIPGSPNQNDNVSRYLGITLDAGPLLVFPIEQPAHVVKPISFKIKALRRGHHRLESSLLQGNRRLGSFVSCFTIASSRTIKRDQFSPAGGF